MATSSPTATSSTNTNFIAALGGGSGIDIKALAQNLVNAEKEPKAALIQQTIDKTELRISGYATVSYAVNQVQTALDGLRNLADFNTFSTASSKASAVSAKVTGTSAAVGSHEVVVTQLAQAQRSVSSGFSAGQSLNGGTAFKISFTIAGSTKPDITVTDTTPAGVVAAINAAGLDVKASLLDTGSGATPLRIVLTGQTGAANSFFLSTVATVQGGPVPSLGFPTDALTLAARTSPDRPALNASLTVNGLSISRSTNKVSDVIDGVTLDLLSVTGADPAVVTLARDTAPIKDKIKAIVTAYNDLQSILDSALDKDSTVEKLGGALVGDSTIRSLRDQVRRILLPDSASSDSSNTPLSNLRQLGLFVDSDRKMKFATLKATAAPGESLMSVGDEGRLDQALSSRFEEVTALFAGSSTSIGIARDMSDRLSGSGAYIDSTASPSSPKKLLAALSQTATQKVATAKERMADLERRMSDLLERYTKQFSIMESLVGQSKSTRTSLESSFKGMSANNN
jgi:flagellar hook-associated protein 2